MVLSTRKLELNYHDQSDRIQSIMKNSQDNDVTYHTGVISVEYDTNMLRSIGSVRFMTMTRQDNNMTNHTCPLNTENKTELSCLIQ